MSDRFNYLVSLLATLGFYGSEWNAAIADCLDFADNSQSVSIEDVFAYVQKQDLAHANQVRWDSRNRHQPVSQSQNFYDSDGFASMLNQVRRGS